MYTAAPAGSAMPRAGRQAYMRTVTARAAHKTALDYRLAVAGASEARRIRVGAALPSYYPDWRRASFSLPILALDSLPIPFLALDRQGKDNATRSSRAPINAGSKPAQGMRCDSELRDFWIFLSKLKPVSASVYIYQASAQP